MNAYEIKQDNVLISTDKALLDRALVHSFLSGHSYWAQGITPDAVNHSIEHSLCFGMYQDDEQVGFCRVVTDFTTFAWLADVFVVEAKRGRGLSKKLMAAVLAHPDLQGLRRFVLGTRDAHGLYAQFGFKPLEYPERFMEICGTNSYKCGC